MSECRISRACPRCGGSLVCIGFCLFCKSPEVRCRECGFVCIIPFRNVKDSHLHVHTVRCIDCCAESCEMRFHPGIIVSPAERSASSS
jgi:hypothetical protein